MFAAFCIALLGPVAASEFHVLCYHDVRDDVRGYLDRDQYAVATGTLVEHLDWLKASEYQFVSLDQVIRAQAGGVPLPSKSVLLTFDDGYRSVYTRVFPLLRLYEAPAVVAVVTKWFEIPAGESITFGDGAPGMPRERFMTWEQARVMRDSGLIEFVSHSHDLHRSITSDPLGGSGAAITSRLFRPDLGTYESIEEWSGRIRDDLNASADLLSKRLGYRPRAMVWPYGEYNHLAVSAARSAGMALNFSLGVPERRLTTGPTVRRHLITSNCPLSELADLLHTQEPQPAIRALEIRVADWYSDDPVVFGRNLDDLMDRATFLGPNRVILDVFERDKEGRVMGTYFPTDRVHCRADVASRFVMLMSRKCGAEVLIPLPEEDSERAAGWAAEIAQRLPLQGLICPPQWIGNEAVQALDAARQWRPELKGYGGAWEGPALIPIGRAGLTDIARVALDGGTARVVSTLNAWLETGARHCGIGPLRPDLTLEEARQIRAVFSSNENPYRDSVTRILNKLY